MYPIYLCFSLFLWPNLGCGINPEVRGQGESLIKLFPHVFSVCEWRAEARGGGGRCWWEFRFVSSPVLKLRAETSGSRTHEATRKKKKRKKKNVDYECRHGDQRVEQERKLESRWCRRRVQFPRYFTHSPFSRFALELWKFCVKWTEIAARRGWC